jgi:hypothetical protein
LAIFKRFPTLAQITAVYSIIVLVIYTWTILWFFWRVPGWLYFLSISEILTVYAYSLVTNLFESLLVLCIPVGLSVILPQKWFSDAFITRSVIVVLSILAYAAYILNQFKTRDDYPNEFFRLIPIILFASVVFAFLAGKVRILVNLIEYLAEQTTVFLYITIPLSLAALLVVLVRSIF